MFMSEVPLPPIRYPRAQRSRNCHCCGQQAVREQRRVGTPTDPDYRVAVCPTCDAAPAS